MKEIFVDTSAWIALVDPSDLHHKPAVAVYPDLLRRAFLLTTNLVVAETHIALRRKIGCQVALAFLEKVRQSKRIRVVYPSSEMDETAVQVLRKYDDQDLSYTDAVSFAVIQTRSIQEAFTYDRHFAILRLILVQ